MIHSAGGTVWRATLSSVRRAYLASSRQGVMSRYRRDGAVGGCEVCLRRRLQHHAIAPMTGA